MMSALSIARAVGGFLSLLTLLGLFVASAVYPSVSVNMVTVTILLGLIGSLLAVDISIEKLGNLSINFDYVEDGGGDDGD